MTLDHNRFMQEAFKEAYLGMNSQKGGPFGAVIVENGTIIGRGHNCVTSSNDPTAHAEIVAIRHACSVKQDFCLKNAILYTTCEPCPMCLSAIYWARISVMYYTLTRHDAEKIGFDDAFIYEELQKHIHQRSVPIHYLEFKDSDKLFQQWQEKTDKISY